MGVIVGSGGTGTEAHSNRMSLPTGTSDPASASVGDMYYNTDDSKIKIYDGTEWSPLGGGSSGINVYDIGNEIADWSYGWAGGVYGEGHQNNHSVNDFTSWNGISGMTDGGEFNRYAVLYGDAKTVAGASVASGHPNSSDPLAAKEVAFYYSTDTTNGTDGNWTVIEPMLMKVAQCKKHSAAGAYIGNRSSAISANHVTLSGNLIKEGYDMWQGRSFSKLYNRGNGAESSTDCGNIFDVITWEPISGVKGIRMDIRSKWDNGAYSGEKPHIAEWKVFEANIHGNTQDLNVNLEDDNSCMCYVDPANVSGNTVPDSSGEGYSFTTNSGGSSGTWSTSSTFGGILTSSGATLRTSNNVNRNSRNEFSYGCWCRLENNGGGLIWHGVVGNNQHYFVRNNIGVNNGFNIGWDIDGNDSWIAPHVEDVRIDEYVSSPHTVGTTWHFFVLRGHASGLCETSIDGKPFEHQFVAGGASPSSSTSAGFGIGGDPYNDNASSHSYGPFFFYAGLIPQWRVNQEWDRHKGRFNRS